MSEFLGLGEELKLAKMSRLDEFANRGFRLDAINESEIDDCEDLLLEEIDLDEEDEEDDEE